MFIKAYFWSPAVLTLFHVQRLAVVSGGQVFFSRARAQRLRVIEVNTLEPLLKTLTPRQSLIRQGFAADRVKLSGSGGENLRESAVMGFGEQGESVRERT
jgi:hypothetical protein